jgi:hypothetical protein
MLLLLLKYVDITVNIISLFSHTHRRESKQLNGKTVPGAVKAVRRRRRRRERQSSHAKRKMRVY